jgi:stage III sporulation protein AG
VKEKLKDDKYVKNLLSKFLSALVIAIVALLLLNVMTQSKDGRMQIVDENGGTEYFEEKTFPTTEEQKLKEILSSIKGVGEVNVMLTYEDREVEKDIFSGKNESGNIKVKGAVITAAGGSKAVTKSNILEAVTALFDIPVRNVKVFEKVEEGNK